ncbi:putative RNA helicase [Cavenderia fasciculata]|uniref:RNA helicase n=1 Tax=Cavenderia fasciculata TaxID=261658 RepID=F4PQ59_CACFS|nr:putative RNA helicase [Cavenderia fasciculata]EGG22522.1 putative RNA helicase [Cavenderia fasciculata]|eukprot:XP_004360373.1 putative RNA helicase [Cavenderia fasciculata]
MTIKTTKQQQQKQQQKIESSKKKKIQQEEIIQQEEEVEDEVEEEEVEDENDEEVEEDEEEEEQEEVENEEDEEDEEVEEEEIEEIEEVEEKPKSFGDLKLQPWLVNSCKILGFKQPSNIQYNTIPKVLEGRDILASAKTGSGKTAAFAIPILSLLSEDPYGVFAVVLTPTRELAVQIGEQFKAIGSAMNVNCAVVIGGIDSVAQSLVLDKRPHIIVATPGRLASHLSNGLKIALKFCKFLVLDEADRILCEDFELEIEKIVEHLPPIENRQTLLYSATMTNNLKKLQLVPMKDPFVFEDNSKYDTVDTLKQHYIYMPALAKDCHLVYLLKSFPQSSCIIFVNNCRTVEAVKGMLNKLDIKTVSLHSFLDQKGRLRALKQFKSGFVKVLIATDVASRGLDIPDVQIVINYKLSNSSKDYIHRVGRTARFGRTGKAISFVTPHDVDLVKNVETAIGKQLELYPTEDDEVYRHLNEASTARKMVEIYLDEVEFGVKEKERREERNEEQKQIMSDRAKNINNQKNQKRSNDQMKSTDNQKVKNNNNTNNNNNTKQPTTTTTLKNVKEGGFSLFKRKKTKE